MNDSMTQRIRSESNRVLNRGNSALRLSIFLFILSTIGVLLFAVEVSETQECSYSYYAETVICEDVKDEGLLAGIIITGVLYNAFIAFMLKTWGHHLRLSAYKGFHVIGEDPPEKDLKPFATTLTQYSPDENDISGDDLDNEPSNEIKNDTQNPSDKKSEITKKKDDGPSSFLSLFNPFK